MTSTSVISPCVCRSQLSAKLLFRYFLVPVPCTYDLVLNSSWAKKYISPTRQKIIIIMKSFIVLHDLLSYSRKAAPDLLFGSNHHNTKVEKSTISPSLFSLSSSIQSLVMADDKNLSLWTCQKKYMDLLL
jgi:hypothetical protein